MRVRARKSEMKRTLALDEVGVGSDRVRDGNVRKRFLERLWHGKREDSPYLTSEEGEREISENDGRT
jgi:hypothetical protein